MKLERVNKIAICDAQSACDENSITIHRSAYS